MAASDGRWPCKLRAGLPTATLWLAPVCCAFSLAGPVLGPVRRQYAHTPTVWARASATRTAWAVGVTGVRAVSCAVARQLVPVLAVPPIGAPAALAAHARQRGRRRPRHVRAPGAGAWPTLAPHKRKVVPPTGPHAYGQAHPTHPPALHVRHPVGLHDLARLVSSRSMALYSRSAASRVPRDRGVLRPSMGRCPFLRRLTAAPRAAGRWCWARG